MRRMVALFFLLLTNSVDASPFRVLVFPHQGGYPSPQGKESVVSKVRVVSESSCNQYVAKMNAKNEWEKVGSPISFSNHYAFTNSYFRRLARFFFGSGDTFYFECQKPFKVLRDSKLESYSYEGDFVVVYDQASIQKPIQIINVIDPEKYIQGVVPSEVSTGWPKEALRAQAVAARSYAWWTVLNSRNKPTQSYDLDDTIAYQAYLGISRKFADTDAAVTDTSRLVMKYAGKVIKAYFSADSGGKTESEANVFGDDLPYCKSKNELYDVSKTQTEWEKTFSYDELARTFSSSLQLLMVEPADLNESGRASLVTLVSANGKRVKIRGSEFRRTLRLRSTLFELNTIMENGVKMLQIKGKGFGHGVGMAQIGAKEYASQMRWTFDQIVKFYYTGITLEPIIDEYSE